MSPTLPAPQRAPLTVVLRYDAAIVSHGLQWVVQFRQVLSIQSYSSKSETASRWQTRVHPDRESAHAHVEALEAAQAINITSPLMDGTFRSHPQL